MRDEREFEVGEEREVAPGEGPERATRPERQVSASRREAPGADDAAREEDLAAGRAARAEQARRLARGLGDRKEAGPERKARLRARWFALRIRAAVNIVERKLGVTLAAG